jgi:hypothetical protein
MQECILNINLTDGLAWWDGKWENMANGGKIYNCTICVTKINSRLLVKTFGNKTNFVANDGAISFVFDVKHLLATNYAHVDGRGDEGPSAIVE